MQPRLHSPSTFWKARLRAHGHTGWNDPAKHAYDQPYRLAVVDSVVPVVSDRRIRALDYGCGTGDFSRLLLAKGWTVWAYDPFVHPALSHSRLHVIRSRDQLRAAGSFDLVLSVTVLDHLLEGIELRSALESLRAVCNPTGRLILLEYALDAPRVSTTYQAFRTLAAWRSVLVETGWDLQDVAPLPHPDDAPTPGFLRFRRRWSVRVLAHLARRGPGTWLARALLGELGRRSVLADGLAQVGESPLKLMMARPLPWPVPPATRVTESDP